MTDNPEMMLDASEVAVVPALLGYPQRLQLHHSSEARLGAETKRFRGNCTSTFIRWATPSMDLPHKRPTFFVKQP